MKLFFAALCLCVSVVLASAQRPPMSEDVFKIRYSDSIVGRTPTQIDYSDYRDVANDDLYRNIPKYSASARSDTKFMLKFAVFSAQSGA
jgi:hypothetical protein